MQKQKQTLIKICGLTTPEDICHVNEVHADFAGFVLFFEKSRRNITIEQAKKLFQTLSKKIKKVAVVVSPAVTQVEAIETAGFDYIQIHGMLKQEILEHTSLPIIKAFNVKDTEQCMNYQKYTQIQGYLFDAPEPGSGKTFDWNLLKTIPRDEKLFLLAGGLHAGNVAKAIQTLLPDGVDVSSGVEYDNGQPGKDPEKIRRFTDAVRTLHLP